MDVTGRGQFKVILFDGKCNLCDRSVQFIIQRDTQSVYKFASLQSLIGQRLCREVGVKKTINTLILLEGNQYFVKSSAVLRVCRDLRGPWKLLYGLILVPKPLRDYCYDIIAKNRYSWFGFKESCMVPAPALQNRFLDK